MADRLDESVLDSMLQDPKMRELYGKLPDREAIRKLLLDQSEFLDSETIEFPAADPGQGEGEYRIQCGNVLVEIAEDEMTAGISLTEPEEHESPITSAEIRKALSNCGIVSGINELYLERLAATPVYRRSFVIAKGIPAIEGTRDKIKYFFDCEKSLRPKESSEGRVDYMELSFAQSVKKGDLLCELIPGIPGTDGYTVTGMVLKADGWERLRIRTGQNTYLSEDQNQLFAACDGEVSMRGGKVAVDKVLVVQNVDASTGNLRFIGSIHVVGKICEGFTVKATGDLTVGEMIEGADVSADGDIQVARGINGAGRGSVKAGGSLRTSFVESVSVSVKKDLFTDVIMTSRVDCGGKVSVIGKRGRLIGGTCSALEIEALEIGNDSHVKTELEIRGMERLEMECAQLGNQLRILQVAENNLQAAANDSGNPDRVKSQKDLLSVIYKRNKLASRRQELADEIARAKADYSFDITARAVIHPNVSLKIGNLSYSNREVQPACVFMRKDGHIVIRKRNY